MRKAGLILSLLFLLLNICPLYSQWGFQVELVEEELFHGTWTAEIGGMELELTFRRARVYEEKENGIGQVAVSEWGKLSFSENAKFVRGTEGNRCYSYIEMVSPTHIFFQYHDASRNVFGPLDFIVAENEPDKGLMKLREKVFFMAVKSTMPYRIAWSSLKQEVWTKGKRP